MPVWLMGMADKPTAKSQETWEETMAHPRAADDFATIRARLEELRRERAEVDRDRPPISKSPMSVEEEGLGPVRQRGRISR